MKKTIIVLCTALFFASALLLISFSAFHAIKGNHLEIYPRFYKTVDGKKQFNPWGLISPVQVESQSIIKDVRFETETAVSYPVAPQFKMVNPTDTSVETAVANEIAKAIADSIEKPVVKKFFDYDGTAEAVRSHAKPVTVQPVKQKIKLSLIGTASPEAVKYGFMQSVQPGNCEVENAELAKERLDRTTAILLRKLHSYGIDTVKLSKKSLELQFPKPVVDSAVAVKQLQNMRFVQARVLVPMEQVLVTPVTAPVLLPIWLGLITLLVSYLLGLRFKRSEKEEEKVESFPIDWMQLFKVLGATLLVSIILTVFMMVLPHIAKYLAIVIGVLIAGITVYAIISMIRTVSVAALWNGAKELVSLIFVWILRAISWIILASIIYVSNAYEWWKAQTTCRKVLLVHFFIDFIILVTWLLGWWHVC